MKTMPSTKGLPEIISLGHLIISIPTDDEYVAEKCFKKISQRVESEFFNRNRRLQIFYDLDIGVEEILLGSKRYKSKPKLRLKSRYSKLQKAGALTSSLFLFIAGYPKVSDGAQRIYQDFINVVKYVVIDEQRKNPDMPPTIESCSPPEDDDYNNQT